MKRLTLLLCAVLVFCLGGCTLAQRMLGNVLDRAHLATVEIFTAMEEGNKTRAKEELVALASLWNEKSPLLELICDHDALHNVKERIIQARICMDYTDMEEFYSAVALIGEGIEHILGTEGLSWSNFL